MKSPLLATITVLAVAVLPACSGDNAEKAASTAVSKTVELVKGAATGASKGVSEGRKTSPSADGAGIVSNGKELRAALTGAVLEIGPAGPGDEAAEASKFSKVTLGFTNDGDTSVRVTELAQKNHVTALDAEGYACTTRHVDDEFTVPAKAKLKVAAVFDCSGKAIDTVRLFDVEYAAADAVVMKK
ncbi:MAG: hypothetical protein QM769_14310 [Pseudoxanthomonas sp.]